MTQFGVDPDTDQVISWLDTWQKDIAIEAGKIVRAEITDIVAKQEIALPTDFASLVELRYNGQKYKKSQKVRVDQEGYITFPEDLSDPITMRYRKIPNDYKSLDTELEPHPLIQPIAIYYLMSLYYDKEGEGDEESNMAARWMAMYEAKKQEIISKINTPPDTDPVVTEDKLPKRSRYHHHPIDDCFEEW